MRSNKIEGEESDGRENSVDPATWLAEQIEHQDPDLLRSMVKTMAETLMSAEADSLCAAMTGQPHPLATPAAQV
ncbi:hypothetical protein ABZ260_31575 [Streptosporangium sp. NPDC006013]|uniref:hypothetical protein n=1 Tax=Streptosporangium sp. NPDC006013 TaxID=3155596 RepID=UPI0033A752D6